MRLLYIIHDSIRHGAIGGAERVLAEMCRLYPEAKLFTVVSDKSAIDQLGIRNGVTNSFLQPLYERIKSFKYLLPLLPLVNYSWKFPENSLVVTSSSLFLKGMRVPKTSIHITYSHTPVRFLWSDLSYQSNESPILLRPFVWIVCAILRRYDKWASGKPTHFIANSREVNKRIKKYYNRDAQTIEAFVDVEFWHPVADKKDYFLLGGRMVPYKGFEDVIRTFTRLGLPLKVFGEGRLKSFLQSIASPNIEFLGKVSDEELRERYSESKVLIYPQLEDFGLPPLEAAACGTPTIGLRAGGTLETVRDGVTGVLVDSIGDLEHTLQSVDSYNFDRDTLREFAKKFDKTIFDQKIKQVIDEYRNRP